MAEHAIDEFKYIKEDVDKLIVIKDFDPIVFNSQIDIIMNKLIKLKKPVIFKSDDKPVKKGWADQMEEEEKEIEEQNKAANSNGQCAETWSKIVTKPKQSDVVRSKVIPDFDSWFDYPFTQTMKACHHVNFHCNTYHWVTRWFESTNILVRTGKHIKFTLYLKDGYAFVSCDFEKGVTRARLSLVDQILICHDDEDKYYDMKVKLIRDY